MKMMVFQKRTVLAFQQRLLISIHKTYIFSYPFKEIVLVRFAFNYIIFQRRNCGPNLTHVMSSVYCLALSLSLTLSLSAMVK